MTLTQTPVKRYEKYKGISAGKEVLFWRCWNAYLQAEFQKKKKLERKRRNN